MFIAVAIGRPRKKTAFVNFDKIEHRQNNSKFCMQLCLCVFNTALISSLLFLERVSISVQGYSLGSVGGTVA